MSASLKPQGVPLRRYLTLLPCLLLLFACGSGDDGPGGQAGGEQDAELAEWMGQVCDAAAQSIQSLPSPMQAREATTEADRQPLVAYLAEARTALDGSIEAAEALPRPPTTSARELASAYRDDLDELAAQLREYEVNATTLPGAALSSLYTLVPVVVVGFQPGGEEMSEYLEGHADLADAYQQAPSCSGDQSTTTAAGPSTTTGPSTTAGTPEEREAALRADVADTFVDQPGGDQQVVDLVYTICASLDATDPDRYYPPENIDEARASSLVEAVAGYTPIELLESIGRIDGNPVLVGQIALLAARHICPEHTAVIEQYASNPPP
jgi:hypothetical protein